MSPQKFSTQREDEMEEANEEGEDVEDEAQEIIREMLVREMLEQNKVMVDLTYQVQDTHTLCKNTY